MKDLKLIIYITYIFQFDLQELLQNCLYPWEILQ